MEAPRLAHTMSSPTSPCEEVIKNLSLEAIQLCDRDDDGSCQTWGSDASSTPPCPSLAQTEGKQKTPIETTPVKLQKGEEQRNKP
ncbi:hypothetical protein DUI87_11868 [Hirundo rustica rustica]|uniref:Uncharacterized protein n=1 Tax=Hirundo rustica rustica TaxID=333673 RepID=A0A3M0KKJ3_HIRRU|nr:hypothetical protein DUI87_11868 [Hirundo rustica rustica]